MAKIKTRRRTTTTTTILKTRLQQLAKALDLSQLKTPGVIYRHQEKGGQGDDPWPKAQARPYGRVSVAISGWRASGFGQCVVLSVPCQVDLLIFGFDALA